MNIVCWWSGGITSAVACKKAIEVWGAENCTVLFIDTKNEDSDTYRFRDDCQAWYGIEITSIWNKKYESIEDVWFDFLSLNTANGAICSSELKRRVRLDYQRKHVIDHQVFGFDAGKASELDRAESLLKNYPASNPIYPLIEFGLTKKDCIKIVESAGIKVPDAYLLGYTNNNCLGTGCVQGGIGYWKKFERDFPEKFNRMAEIEHQLTDLKGKQVTCLKDQSKWAEETGLFQVFLKKHPNYPNKCLADKSAREPESLVECNGFCGTQGELFPT